MELSVTNLRELLTSLKDATTEDINAAFEAFERFTEMSPARRQLFTMFVNETSPVVKAEDVFTKRAVGRPKKSYANASAPLKGKLKAYREANNMSQQNLANHLSASRTYIGALEQGKFKHVGAAMLRKLVNGTGLPEAYWNGRG